MKELSPKTALTQLNRDYKRYTDRYHEAAVKDGFATESYERAQKYREYASQAEEIHADPESGWQGAGQTVDNVRAALERDVAEAEASARSAQSSANSDRHVAESLIQQDSAARYQASPNAFYHAAVADAHMDGVHIKTGEQPQHAVNVVAERPQEPSM